MSPPHVLDALAAAAIVTYATPKLVPGLKTDESKMPKMQRRLIANAVLSTIQQQTAQSGSIIGGAINGMATGMVLGSIMEVGNYLSDVSQLPVPRYERLGMFDSFGTPLPVAGDYTYQQLPGQFVLGVAEGAVMGAVMGASTAAVRKTRRMII